MTYYKKKRKGIASYQNENRSNIPPYLIGNENRLVLVKELCKTSHPQRHLCLLPNVIYESTNKLSYVSLNELSS